MKQKSTKKQKKAVNRKKKSAEKSRMIIEYMQDYGTIHGITKNNLKQHSANRKEEEKDSFKFLSRLTYLSILQLVIVFSYKFWTFNQLSDEFKLLSAVLIIPAILLFYSFVVSRIYYEDESTKKSMLIKGRRIFDHLLLYSDHSPPYRFLLTMLVFNVATSLAHFEKIQFNISTYLFVYDSNSESISTYIYAACLYLINMTWYVFWFATTTWLVVWFPKRVVDVSTNLISAKRTESVFTLEVIYYCILGVSLVFSLIEALYAMSKLI